MHKSLVLIATLVIAATTAQAQSIIPGAGFADFSDSASEDQAVFALEYQHRPFHQSRRFSATWGAALSVDEDGDSHFGAGLVGVYSLNERWFVEASVMPGIFSESNALNDLGGSFQIRSLLALGFTLDSGNKISLAVTHKSNASTQEENPGVNAVLFRYHFAF